MSARTVADHTEQRLRTWRLTPWFAGKAPPRRRGWYRVQDEGLRCSCCWFMAHWDGSEWHTESMSFPGARRWLPSVRRWRGMASRAA